jgi:deazaflavin-dependent oxidoreductase (nitroreductase family)
MEAAMPMPRAITRFNRSILNRVLSPAASRLPSFGILVHRGRKSGRTYRTPVNIFRRADGYAIALTYGVGDWVRNVLAAGECTLITRGRSYRMTRPRLVHDETRRVVPAALRVLGAIANVSDFLYLNHARTAAAGARQVGGVPSWVPFFNPIAKLLLAAGVPMAFNKLVTIRGRRSGRPRTTPLTVVEAAGRRWVLAPYGEGDWVRNLRAAGRATITAHRRKEEVRAIELDPARRAEFFRDVLAPLARGIPLGAWIVRHVDRIDLDHPVEAAEGRPVFELFSVGFEGTKEAVR